MTRTTQILTGVAAVIFLLSFFLPSRLTSNYFSTIVSFAKSNQIGYGIYGLIIFPIVLLLILTKKYLVGIYMSTFLILTQLDSIDRFIDFFTADSESTIGIGYTYPFVLVTSILTWLIYKSVKTKKWTWYLSFVAIVFLSYVIFNDRNCMIEFVADISGISRLIKGPTRKGCCKSMKWFVVNFSCLDKSKTRVMTPA